MAYIESTSFAEYLITEEGEVLKISKFIVSNSPYFIEGGIKAETPKKT
jgi:hypothetical protein